MRLDSNGIKYPSARSPLKWTPLASVRIQKRMVPPEFD
jgi:hypothetical protein